MKDDKRKDQPEHPEPSRPKPDAEPQDDGTIGVPEGPGKNPPPPNPPENP